MEYRSDCEEEGAGLVAHSGDGGVTWTTATAGPRAVLDLQFLGGGEGWALSGVPYWWDSAGRLLHTTDGGATWTEVKIGPRGTVRGFRAMYFADQSEGWILSDGDYEGTLLLHTIDGGAHWGAVNIREAWGLQALCFAGNDDGWVAGSETTILATEDGGGIAPMSVANVGYSRWTNKDFTVKVTTADDGLGLAPTQTRVGSGPWEDTATRLVRAPKNHSNDGYTLVRYRGVDLAGNREEVSGALVAVDTRPPTVVARDRSRAHSMRIASLRLKADRRALRLRARVQSERVQEERRTGAAGAGDAPDRRPVAFDALRLPVSRGHVPHGRGGQGPRRQPERQAAHGHADGRAGMGQRLGTGPAGVVRPPAPSSRTDLPARAGDGSGRPVAPVGRRRRRAGRRRRRRAACGSSRSGCAGPRRRRRRGGRRSRARARACSRGSGSASAYGANSVNPAASVAASSSPRR